MVTDPAHDRRRLTWRSVIASVLLVAAVPAVVAAISYPLVTALLALAVSVAADHALRGRDTPTRLHPSALLTAAAMVTDRD